MPGEVLNLMAAEPGLRRPLAGADDYLRAEVVYAVTHEGARHLDDVLARRTHVSIESWDRGGGADGRPHALAVPPGQPGAGELQGPGRGRAGLPGGGHRHRRGRDPA